MKIFQEIIILLFINQIFCNIPFLKFDCFNDGNNVKFIKINKFIKIYNYSFYIFLQFLMILSYQKIHNKLNLFATENLSIMNLTYFFILITVTVTFSLLWMLNVRNHRNHLKLFKLIYKIEKMRNKIFYNVIKNRSYSMKLKIYIHTILLIIIYYCIELSFILFQTHSIIFAFMFIIQLSNVQFIIILIIYILLFIQLNFKLLNDCINETNVLSVIKFYIQLIKLIKVMSKIFGAIILINLISLFIIITCQIYRYSWILHKSILSHNIFNILKYTVGSIWVTPMIVQNILICGIGNLITNQVIIYICFCIIFYIRTHTHYLEHSHIIIYI